MATSLSAGDLERAEFVEAVDVPGGKVEVFVVSLPGAQVKEASGFGHKVLEARRQAFFFFDDTKFKGAKDAAVKGAHA